MRAAETRETRAHHKVVRIVAADRLARETEIEVGREFEEVELHRLARRPRHAAFCEELLLCDPGAMRLGQRGDRVEQARVGTAAAPPRQFVVDEVAEEPGIVAVRGAGLAGARPDREVRMEDVRKRRTRTMLVRANEVVGVARVPAQAVADRKEDGMHETAVLERHVAARPQEVETPRLQTLQRVRLPVRLVRELRLHRLVVVGLPDPLAVVAPVRHMVHAQQHHAAAERVDHPPPAVLLLHAEEARRRRRHLRHEAVALIGGEGRPRLRPRIQSCASASPSRLIVSAPMPAAIRRACIDSS